MKFPTVDKFFFCLSLETGAVILAGLTWVLSILLVSFTSFLLARYVSFFATLNETDQNFFRPLLTTFVVVYTIYLLYFGLFMLAAVLLVLGTIKRNHNQILLFIILLAVNVLVFLVQIFQLGFLFLIPSILATVLTVYFLICICSLYNLIKAEKVKPEANRQYENVTLRNL